MTSSDSRKSRHIPVTINGVEGFFLTKEELLSLLANDNSSEVNVPTTVLVEESDSLNARNQLTSLEAQKNQLRIDLALCSDPEQRTRINLQSQQLDSQIARLKKLL